MPPVGPTLAPNVQQNLNSPQVDSSGAPFQFGGPATPPPPSTPTTPPGSNPPPSATPASLGLTTPAGTGSADSAIRAASGGYYDANGNVQAAPTFNDIYQNTLNGFQSEIDQIEKNKVDQQARIRSDFAPIAANRVGETTATNARRGLAGSDFGNAATDTVNNQNSQELSQKIQASDAIYNQQKAQLYDSARSMANDQYNAKTTAYTSGAKTALDWITTGKPQMQQKQVTDFVNQAVSGNVDLTDKSHSDVVQQAAAAIGVAPGDLVKAYQDTIKAQKKAADEGAFNLSPGETRYRTDGTTIATGGNKPDVYKDTKDAAGNPIVFNETKGQYEDGLGNKLDPTKSPTDSTYIDPTFQAKFTQNLDPNRAKVFAGFDNQTKSNVIALSQGRISIEKLMTSRGLSGSAARQQLLNQILAVDPTYTEDRYTYRQKFDDPNGKSQTIMNAMNTALQHTSVIKSDLNQLAGLTGNFKGVNSLSQLFSKYSNGDSPLNKMVQKFKQDQELLAHETANIYANGNAADVQSIDNARKILDPTTAPSTLSDLLDNSTELIGGRLSSYGEAYHKVMNSYPENPIINNETLDALQSSGIKTQHLTTQLIKQGMPASSVKDYESAFPQKAAVVDQMVRENPQLSEQDVLQVLQGSSPYLNNVGGDTQPASNQTSYTPLQQRNLAAAPQDTPKVQVQIGAGAAIANNNPGNLRNTDGSWQKFNTPEEGWQALLGYVERAKTGDSSIYKPGMTLYQFFAHYAPSSDNNNPKAYAEAVAKQVGLSPLATIGTVPTFELARAIAYHDSSTKIKTLS